ncbi:major capsid protein [Apis mellifera associated microvirus 53]|nr:major capsid protein [Apis mellifera associated microvirus 53]
MKRSKFSLSNYRLLTANMGQLIPCGLTEVLPGDSIQQATSALIRCAPMVTPPMHPVHVRIHHFYVPNRIIWDDFEDFITGGPDGMSVPDFPVIKAPASTGFAVGSLADHLGIRPGVPDIEVSALPFRGVALIYNEYYRDQDLQTPLVISKASGLDTTTNTSIQHVAWEKDYFTSARPWTQKGPEVTVPVGESAPVKWDTFSGATNADNKFAVGYNSSGVGLGFGDTYGVLTGAVPNSSNNLFADLSSAAGVDINTLREAFALQRYEEARARYGSRYTEYLAYLGVHSSDARLQRPEYLGGGKQTIQFSEILQTGPDGDGDGVGNLKGHGIGALRSNRYRRFFEEHGFIYSFISIKPKTIYADGIPRHFNRRIKEDFWQKELQHIGQQEVLLKEVYAGAPDPDAVFGFQDRYDEYRRSHSYISGEFRSVLDDWHFARMFGNTPALNADFIKSTPAERPFAYQDNDVLYMMVNHSIQARRMVAKTGSSFIF